MTTGRYGLIDPAEDRPDNRAVFPAQSTVLDELALGKLVSADYPIAADGSCRFLMRGDADIYRIRADGADFYLKLYRPPQTLEQTENEAQYVAYLADRGVPVVRPVRSVHGCYANCAMGLEGPRPLLLYESAPPEEVPFDDPHACRELGEAIARLHQVTDGLNCTYNLPVCDFDTVTERLPYAEPYLPPADYAFLRNTSTALARSYPSAGQSPPGFGLCHADLVMSNLRYQQATGITFFDFGNAAYTWRLIDISTAAGSYARRSEQDRDQVTDLVMEGYSRVRELPPDNRQMLPAIQILSRLGWISGNAASLPLRLGTDPLEGDIFSGAIQFIRDNIERCLNAG